MYKGGPSANFSHDINIKTGFPYMMGNEDNLDYDFRMKNYKSRIWGTFLQFNELGYRVRKGEKSSEISHFRY